MRVRKHGLIGSAAALSGLLSSLAGAAPASAQPTPAAVFRDTAAKLDAEPQDAARAALRRGRELGSQGDWAAAVTVLRAAVALDASSAAVQSELGWAALHKGELDLAEQSSRAALAHAGDDRTRAGAGYNLGRVLEARGDREGAAAAYSGSLAARRSAAVLARLAKLDAAAAAKLGPVQFADLKPLGPGPDKPVCDKSPPVPNPEGYQTFDCRVIPLPAKLHLPAPWLAAQLQLRQWADGESSPHADMLVLLLRTAKGWFSAELERNAAVTLRESWEFKVLSITIGKVTGQPPLLIVRTRENYSAEWLHSESEHFIAENFHLLAVGASGSPVGSDPISEYIWDDSDKKEGHRIAARLHPDGVIELRAVKGKPTEEQAAMLGRHQLLLP